MTDYGPQITAARLYRRKSANGNDDFAGRWGACKVALLKSRDIAEDGSEVWNLVLSEAPTKSDAGNDAVSPGSAGSADGSRTAARGKAKRDWQRPAETATPASKDGR